MNDTGTTVRMFESQLSDAEWAAERRAMETLDSSLTGRHIIVADVEPSQLSELGYTSQGSVIHVARDHAYYQKLSREEAAVFRFGVNVHEAMHQVYTDFDSFHQAVESIYGSHEKFMFSQICNLIEDPAIENFADQAVGGFALDALYYMIETLYEEAAPVSGPQNHGQALNEYIEALIQFGDRGIIKGGFSSDKAREYFNRTASIIYRAINEPNGAERIRLSMEVYNIVKGLWAGKPENAVQQMTKAVAGRYGKSATDGSGSGKSPQKVEDVRNDERKQQMDEQKEKELDALRKDAGLDNGNGENTNDQNDGSGRENQDKQDGTSDTDNKKNAGKEIGNETGANNADQNGNGNTPEDGNGSGNGKEQADDDLRSDNGTGNGNASGDGSEGQENRKDGKGSGSCDGASDNQTDDIDEGSGNVQKYVSAEKTEDAEAQDGSPASGEDPSDENSYQLGKKTADSDFSENPQYPEGDSGTEDKENYSDKRIFRYNPDIVSEFAKAMQQFMEQQEGNISSQNQDETAAPESFSRVIVSQNRQFNGVTEMNVVAPSEGYEDAYADILNQAAWIIGPLTNQLKKIFSDDRGGKAYTQRGKVSLKRAASGRVTTRMFERRIMPGDKADMCLMLLMDLSGSMRGTKEQAAKLTAIVLSETFACFGTPVYCMGFQHMHGADAYQTHFVRWRNTPAERISILSVKPNGNNFDAYSIRYATQLLRKRAEKHKLLCVISDGLPSHYFYGEQGIAENALAIQDARMAGINVFGAAIAANEPDKFLQMYGQDYFINILKPQDLADQTAGLIKTVVRDW